MNQEIHQICQDQVFSISTTELTVETIRNETNKNMNKTLFLNNNKSIWKYGKVTKRLGRLHYLITLDGGRNIKRHMDQLRTTKDSVEKRKKVTFADEQDEKSQQGNQ